MNWAIWILIFTIIFLFVSMVLSAMSASDSTKSKNNPSSAKKYSTWSALVAAFAFVLLFAFMAFKTKSWMSITLVLAMLLLFTTMFLSSTASSAADSNLENSHNYAIYSSVVTGVAVALIVVFLILFMNKDKVVDYANQGYNYINDQYKNMNIDDYFKSD